MKQIKYFSFLFYFSIFSCVKLTWAGSVYTEEEKEYISRAFEVTRYLCEFESPDEAVLKIKEFLNENSFLTYFSHLKPAPLMESSFKASLECGLDLLLSGECKRLQGYECGIIQLESNSTTLIGGIPVNVSSCKAGERALLETESQIINEQALIETRSSLTNEQALVGTNPVMMDERSIISSVVPNIQWWECQRVVMWNSFISGLSPK